MSYQFFRLTYQTQELLEDFASMAGQTPEQVLEIAVQAYLSPWNGTSVQAAPQLTNVGQTSEAPLQSAGPRPSARVLEFPGRSSRYFD
jgi:hypothetical protein